MPVPWLDDELAALEEAGLARVPRVLSDLAPHGAPTGPTATVDGHDEVLVFCSNDYLGLSAHPAIKDAAIAAVTRSGVGAGSSRLISGTRVVHRELEERLAAWLGTEKALLFSTGFMANLAVLATLAGPDDVILSDELNHASIVAGCRLSRAKVLVYQHRDPLSLEAKLEQTRWARRRLVVTDSLFSVDGDAAPVGEIHGLARDHDAAVVVDEAHALGVLGPKGRGLCVAAGAMPDALVGTFGKAFGVAGAFVAGSARLIGLLQSRAASHIFTTAPPPLIAAACLAALDIIEGADEAREQLLARSSQLRRGIEDMGLAVGQGRAHIVPAIIGGIARTMGASQLLYERGLFVQGLRPPTVAAGTERLRWAATAEHQPHHIELAVELLAQVMAEVDGRHE